MSEGLSFPWEREAMRGEEIPADCKSVYDQMAFLSLRALYRYYYDKRITRDAAAAEKQKILKARDSAKRAAKWEKETMLYYAQLNRDTETAKTAVLKDPTPENAIRLVRIMDGLEKYMPKEEENENRT